MQTCSLCAGNATTAAGDDCPRCDGRGWLHDLEALRFERANEMKAIEAALVAVEDIKSGD